MIRHDYNPDALQRIRNGACARDLGWPESFYRSVCRRHGLQPIPSPSATPDASPDAQPISQPDEDRPSARQSDADYKPKRIKPKRIVTPRSRTGERRYPVNINAIVSRDMGTEIHNFAAREEISQLEAVRRLLAAGLMQFKFKPDQVIE